MKLQRRPSARMLCRPQVAGYPQSAHAHCPGGYRRKLCTGHVHYESTISRLSLDTCHLPKKLCIATVTHAVYGQAWSKDTAIDIPKLVHTSLLPRQHTHRIQAIKKQSTFEISADPLRFNIDFRIKRTGRERVARTSSLAIQPSHSTAFSSTRIQDYRPIRCRYRNNYWGRELHIAAWRKFARVTIMLGCPALKVR
jgi:hypothetical protein